MHPKIEDITQRIIERSAPARAAYLDKIRAAADSGVARNSLSCGNLAHACASSSEQEKSLIVKTKSANLGIITAYNDMLSAHQPFKDYPDLIKQTALQYGASAQVAGGVPAMCDGVTQGQPGMELSLFSRDVIAMSTAVALSHNVFDGAVYLGVCDKIVPGLLIGALAFGHLPVAFVPAGPMESGISNGEKVRIRQLYAEGKISREELLEAECQSYHSPGTCTFYGTANSNQMLMEIMGLQLPGSSFVNPSNELRAHLTQEAVLRVCDSTMLTSGYTPIAEIVNEKAVVNGIVGLLATGGSTNHAIHLIAMARAAGVSIDWRDMSELSDVVPTLCQVYPSGQADINHFHAVGGMSLLIRELLSAGLVHNDVKTMFSNNGLQDYCLEPKLINGNLVWQDGPSKSLDLDIIATAEKPFSAQGGLKLLEGNVGRSVIKISAVKKEHWSVTAPAVVFEDQDQIKELFDAGELDKDFVAVVRLQGPKANGMPELHKLTPLLGVLQDRGFKVALVTDGRMSGASGKVPAAIHMTPEALEGGAIARIKDGDMLELNVETGCLRVLEKGFEKRASVFPQAPTSVGVGRELFAGFRAMVGSAEDGASVFATPSLENNGAEAWQKTSIL